MRTRSPPARTQPQLRPQRSCRIPRLPHNPAPARPTLLPPRQDPRSARSRQQVALFRRLRRRRPDPVRPSVGSEGGRLRRPLSASGSRGVSVAALPSQAARQFFATLRGRHESAWILPSLQSSFTGRKREIA